MKAQKINKELKGMIITDSGSQQEFAKNVKIKDWKITGLVRGSYNPTQEEIDRLVKRLGKKVLKVL